MDGTKPLTEQLRDWYANSPTVQQAYARVRADADALVEQVKPFVQDFWAKIGPMIDPPPKDEPETPTESEAPGRTPSP